MVFDEAAPSNSKVEIEVNTSSVDTGNKKRDDHLRNQDFFKVKEYPKMSFKSTKVTKKGDGKYEIAGKFTLLDKTKDITVTFERSSENAGKTSFQIKRSDYGMKYRVPRHRRRGGHYPGDRRDEEVMRVFPRWTGSQTGTI